MKTLVKQLVPKDLYRLGSRIYRGWLHKRELSRMARLPAQTTAAERGLVARVPKAVPERILIVPSDPITLVGALGDEAMISTTIAVAHSRNPAVEIDILVNGEKARMLASKRGLTPQDIWSAPDFPAAVVRCLNERAYDAVVAVGADSVDGIHVPYHSASIVTAAHLAARAGIPATILGFSISTRMSPAVAALFDRVDPRLQLNVRDEISLGRFRTFTKAQAELVTDSAFLFPAGRADAETEAWIETHKRAGRLVVGINLHPLLVIDSANFADSVARMNEKVAESLLETSSWREIAWLMLPHDYRRETGDGVCLRPIFEAIAPQLGDRVRYLDGIRRADELKAVAAKLDGVVTGRMHLAIGSFSMGTPVLSLTYFDKFEGLYRHFRLPDWLLLPPSVVRQDGLFHKALNRFVDELVPLRAQVVERLPHVIEASRRNFAVLLADGAE